MKTVLARWVKVAGVCAALALGGFGGAAHAQVVCDLASTTWAVNFGEYDGAVNDTAVTNAFRLNCTNSGNANRTVKVCVGLGDGAGGASGGWRLMKNDANQLQYNIYHDEARTQVFGLLSDQAELTHDIAANATAITPGIRLYGRIPAGQTAASGPYASTFSGADAMVRYGDFPPGGAEPDCASLIGNEIPYTSSFPVQASVPPSCAIVAMPTMSFGEQTSLSANLNNVSFVIMWVRCNPGTPYSIAMDNGQNAQGNQRYMRLGSTPNLIHYDIYQGASRTVRWGSDDSERKYATGNGGNQNHRIYGRVPGPQTITAAGEYKDTVVVTVHY